MPRRPESGDVTDLGTEHPGMDSSHSVEALDHPIPDVVSEPGMDPRVQSLDLGVEDLDQLPQRPHPDLVGFGEGDLVEIPGAGGAHISDSCGITPSLPKTECS